jgi:hypothetical protein
MQVDLFGNRKARQAALDATLKRIALNLEYEKAYERARAQADVAEEADRTQNALTREAVRLYRARAEALASLQEAEANDLAISAELVEQISKMAALNLGGGRNRDGTFAAQTISLEGVRQLERAFSAIATQIAGRRMERDG